ncbi:radical SAM protein [Desulfonatronospira sp.]|uniref:B12-binding domain-containing radical SAM protein n=1 Tax=Desulfonatronospira sp. TaxID=1962951 RepID=UPI0025BA31BB|nr:radical SAM protein [Desulfonatronospira sp.]
MTEESLLLTNPGEEGSSTYRHVLCVYPYRRELKELGFLPPLGLEHIAAVIEPFASELEMVDLRRYPGHASDFIRSSTDLVCFSVNWDLERDFVARELSSIDSEITLIAGGRYATEAPDQWLEHIPGLDAVVRGDGEEIMLEICRQVPWHRISGLSFRRDGRIIHNPNREPGSILDRLQPCRSRRRQKYDVQIRGIGTGLEVDMLAGSRGCPFNCTFCSFNRNPWGIKRKWTARSPESVVDELESISAPLVAFTDDLFTHDLSRVENICDQLLKRGIKKKYVINARLEIARHPALIRKMEQAGFAILLLGVESAHDKTLKAMRKGFTTRQIRSYCKVLQDSTMIKHGYFILGNIGESVDEMLQTAPFAREIGMDSISLSTLRHNPYSGLDELVAQTPGYHINPKGKIYSDHCPPKQLRKLRRRLYRDFYSTRQILKLGNKFRKHGALKLLPGIAWNLAAHRVRQVMKR